ncbi:hypothetical protein PRZ48_000494 [Zasmidium cellare]|uniref:Tr-type G domain-containing protein n=1 Tax=Zasmidium cellare TaxID=395010 RepID=A0ABR0EYN1_ZASCE|nr:hypothetical protein PRZ48_000494 [Zasmidium cellare]
MLRHKNIEYDEDELYSDEGEDYAEEGGYTQEDKDNFATLTPVVRAELDEAGVPTTAKQIEDALWHYYWDVGKSVAYLKNSRTPREGKQEAKKEEKPKSKFEQAAEKADEVPFMTSRTAEWFKGVPWTNVPCEMIGQIVPAEPEPPRIKLLGGSSKLAKLAEERRKKAAAAAQPAQPSETDSASSLDRLTKPKDVKENVAPVPKAEPKKYAIRRKRSPTPPPKAPTPPPEEPKEQLPSLRSSPSAFGRALSSSSGQTNGTRQMALQDLLGSSYSSSPFEGPSPDDAVIQKAKAQQASNGLAKKTEALKIESTPAAPSQPKVRSKGLDVASLWNEEKSKRKASAAFVVIGHVDHGKSTLMGRLLLDTGAVSQRDIDKYKKQATELGKASFALAWVMDTGSEERERGVTVDIAQHYFSTDNVDFTILDAPGHRDFVPNMIGGASMADLAVLVVDANQLESGMKGQTREHILLAHAVGLQKLVVAVNKLDSTTPAWDQEIFRSVSAEVLKLLKQTGFTEENVAVIPCSGLSGENVAKAPAASSGAAWVSKEHPTLLQQLEKFAPHLTSIDTVKKPLRLQIADVFRGGITNPLSIAGRIKSGNVQVGDSVTIQPSGETATIKGIEVSGEGRDWTVSDDIPTLHLVDIEPQHLRSGDVVCSSQKPVKVVKNITAKVQALDSLLPQRVDIHVGRLHVPGGISHLVATEDARGETLKKKPRIVKAGQRAVIRLALDDGVPLEDGDRIVLRTDGSTIAAGRIEAISL